MLWVAVSSSETGLAFPNLYPLPLGISTKSLALYLPKARKYWRIVAEPVLFPLTPLG